MNQFTFGMIQLQAYCFTFCGDQLNISGDTVYISSECKVVHVTYPEITGQ